MFKQNKIGFFVFYTIPKQYKEFNKNYALFDYCNENYRKNKLQQINRFNICNFTQELLMRL